MTAFKIEITDAPVLAAFNRLLATGRDADPILEVVGERLRDITLDAFDASASPDGAPWAPNSEATLLAVMRRAGGDKGVVGKRGATLARPLKALAAKKPLIGETGVLSSHSITYNVAAGVLEFGSTRRYAAMQQFGGTKAQFPHLWGDIPARPFLPVTAAGQFMEPAQRAVIDIFNEALADAWQG